MTQKLSATGTLFLSMESNVKTCSKCLVEKPLTEFGKHCQTKDGLKSRCKLCNTAESTVYRNSNLEKVRAKDRLRPHLPRPEYCKEYYAENRDKLLEKGAVYREENRAEVNAKTEKWKADNPDKVLAQAVVYREKNRRRIKAGCSRWKSANPGKVNADAAKRRAAKLKATPKWANATAIRAIYVEASRLGKEVDHIIPLRSPTVCGLHWEGNLQLLTPFENAQKGNSYATPWDGA